MRQTFIFFFFSIQCIFAQKGRLEGIVRHAGLPIKGVEIFTKKGYPKSTSDSNGYYILKDLPLGHQTLIILTEGYDRQNLKVNLQHPTQTQDIELTFKTKELSQVVISGKTDGNFGIQRMRSVEAFGIYESKKNEVIVIRDLTANLANNNTRQTYAKVPGLNIWENDGGGLQLGIGGRGLSPNRTSNFNTRQNGYDISADALGYPESYYTPPLESLEKIQIVRGASSLQYGTQFGGMLNFKLKSAPEGKKMEIKSRQTIGSWKFFNCFNSIAGTVNRFSYYSFYQRKQGDGWRPNSEFEYNMAYSKLAYRFSEKLYVYGDYTYMKYLAHQPGGLTDALFAQNPQQSIRKRNWFKVDWNLASIALDYNINNTTKLNIRNFGLLATRNALGNLERIYVADFGQNRDLIYGRFKNFGNETRLIRQYLAFGKSSIVLAGFRIYHGHAQSQQGEADSGEGANFAFVNPKNLENSDFLFPSKNHSIFVENIINLGERVSLTPGFRLENIQTFSKGYYKQRVYDAAGNVIVDNPLTDTLDRKRTFSILGLGFSYKPNEKQELYANISQNYRAINFNDIRINNPNIQIDPDIEDEKGYSADIGYRGNYKKVLNFDASVFLLAYKNRIGLILKADQPPLYLDYRFRTNIAEAQNLGFEFFTEFNFLKALNSKAKNDVNFFLNYAHIHARYTATKDESIRNKEVELVPANTLKVGLNHQYKKWKNSFLWSFTDKQFTDATNARSSSSAVNGLIPSYKVADFSSSFQFNKYWQLELSCNNIFSEKYFTRRADSYPGPGIIPSDARSYYVTLQISL